MCWNLQGADIFAAKVNIEVQRASELAIAAIEKNGGVVTTSFYDPRSLGKNFFLIISAFFFFFFFLMQGLNDPNQISSTVLSSKSSASKSFKTS